jgi:hypothetical protein
MALWETEIEIVGEWFCRKPSGADALVNAARFVGSSSVRNKT